MTFSTDAACARLREVIGWMTNDYYLSSAVIARRLGLCLSAAKLYKAEARRRINEAKRKRPYAAPERRTIPRASGPAIYATPVFKDL